MQTEKSVYEAPVLVEVGSLESITLASTGGATSDQIIPAGAPIKGATS